MKKTFARFMALVLALSMLLGMAMAEPVEVQKTHVVLNWLGQLAEGWGTLTEDEDGCTRYNLTVTENGQAFLSAFMQLGEALTLGSSAEDALTLTPEAIQSAMDILTQTPEDPALAQAYSIATALLAYFEDDGLEADLDALSAIVSGEVVRLLQMTMALGCLTISDEEIRLELDNAAWNQLSSGYCAALASDQAVSSAIASLKIWEALGMQDKAAEMLDQAMAMIAALGTPDQAAENEPYVNLVVSIKGSTVTVSLAVTENGVKNTAEATASYDDEQGIRQITGEMFIEGVSISIQGTVDPANSEFHYIAKASSEGSELKTVQYDAVYANGFNVFQKTTTPDGETATMGTSFNPETLHFFYENARTIMDPESGELFSESSLRIEGDPAVTDDVIAYALTCVTDMNYPSYQLEYHDAFVLTLGLRNLEPEQTDIIHGEVFLENTDAEDGTTTSLAAAEFIITSGNPQTVHVILTAEQVQVADLLVEMETLLDEAPAHINGTEVTGEELASAITGLLSMLGSYMQ